MILIIDNYDSFVFNLARYLRELGAAVDIVRNDKLTVAEALARKPEAIVISPGPCGPATAGISTALAKSAVAQRIPFLGVCLGHQCLVTACGGTIERADAPAHGRAFDVTHNRTGLFNGLPAPLTVGRYHSLVAGGDMPLELEVTATLSQNGTTVMAVAHKTAPAFGVQFHPESILTVHGHDLLRNFLTIAKTNGKKNDEARGGS
ncbi:aminodeoxychorismate/anthranilate synthase component II [Pyruvatibacter sp.]|uniref:anthranilate synthase component II n=1 Tax=Pyruvatibacter sp. TaxID=1981328 RepID=UPI0032EF4336